MYDPYDWYWIVADSTTQVYSSKTGNYVPVSDSTYQEWQIAGNTTTCIDSEASLGEVLAPYGLRPVAANVLNAYTTSQANNLTVEVVAKILFNHENRIRTLAGQPTITAAQFVNAIKALL